MWDLVKYISLEFYSFLFLPGNVNGHVFFFTELRIQIHIFLSDPHFGFFCGPDPEYEFLVCRVRIYFSLHPKKGAFGSDFSNGLSLYIKPGSGYLLL